MKQPKCVPEDADDVLSVDRSDILLMRSIALTLVQALGVAKRPKSGMISVLGHRSRTLLDLGTVTAAALALRLPAAGFGLPAMLHPDEPGNIYVGANMAASGSWDPHYFSYPSLLFDAVDLADRAQRLFTGHMLLPNSFSSEGIGINRTANPDTVLGLRLVTVALSVGICLIVYGVLKRITQRRWVAVGGGLLAATSPLLVTNGVFVTPDTYSAFFTAATLAASLAVVRRGTRLDYVLAGVAVGFTTGSKYDVVSAVPVMVAYALREGRNLLKTPALVSLASAAVSAAAAFALTTPAVLFDTGSLVMGFRTEFTHYSTGHQGAQGGAFGFYLSAIGHDQWIMLPGVILAVAAARLGRFRKEIVVVGAFALGYFALIASEQVRFDRDVLPLLPALMLLTGFAVAGFAELVAGRWRRPGIPEPGRLVLTTAMVAAVMIPAVLGSAGVPETLDEAPRTEAAAWVTAHIPPGSSVVDENYGPWISAASYNLTHVSYVASVALPPNHQAVIVTEEGSGRFIDDPKDYPGNIGVYEALLTHYCVAVKYTNGPWVEVLTPCGERG